MADKMNICLINDSFPPLIDGVANTVLNYASIIEREYGTATVATPYYPGADDSAYPYKVVRFPSIDTTKLVGYRAGFPFSAETLEEIRSRKIDLIHTHCPIMSTFLARTLRDTLDVPVILTYHTKFDIDIANAVRGKLLQKGAIKALVNNISACDEVWAVSRGAGENLRSIGYTGDYVVMENGVDLPKGRLTEEEVAKATKDFDLPAEVPVFLFVGRMVWYKGLRCILEALAELYAKGQDFRMVFIGGGADKDGAKELANQFNIGEKCFFLGPVYDRDVIRAWYCRSDLFLFPSEFDTNGLVVREAAACGLGSVLVEGSCAAEGIVDEKTGFLVKNAPSDMAAKLLEILKHPEIMRTVGQNAMNEIYISWEDSVKRAVERYHTVLENYRSGKYERRRGFTDEWFKMSGEILEAVAKAQEFAERRPEEMKKRVGNVISGINEKYSTIKDSFAQRFDRYL